MTKGSQTLKFKDVTAKTKAKSLLAYKRLEEKARQRQEQASKLPTIRNPTTEQATICINNTNNIRDDDGIQRNRISNLDSFLSVVQHNQDHHQYPDRVLAFGNEVNGQTTSEQDIAGVQVIDVVDDDSNIQVISDDDEEPLVTEEEEFLSFMCFQHVDYVTDNALTLIDNCKGFRKQNMQRLNHDQLVPLLEVLGFDADTIHQMGKLGFEGINLCHPEGWHYFCLSEKSLRMLMVIYRNMP